MEYIYSAIGGVNLPSGWNLTRPLVRLDANHDRVVIAPRLGIGRFRGPWEFSRDQVRTMRRSAGSRFPLLSGIEIVMRDGGIWIFWCGDPDEVLTRLAGLGYPAGTAQSE